MEYRNSQVELREIVKTSKRKWWVILGVTLAFGLIARGICVMYLVPNYEVETTVFVGKEQSNTEEDTGVIFSDLQVSSYLINDYKNIAHSRHVITSVINDMGMNISIVDFKKKLNVEIVEDSRILSITYRDTDAELAAEVANETARQLSIAVKDIMNVDNIKVIDKAVAPGVLAFPTNSMITVAAAFAGFMISLLGIYFNIWFRK